MQVKLINYTRNPEKIIAQSARLCYSALGIQELGKKLDDQSVEKIIKKIKRLGHYSVLEHAVFTFGLEGISRVTSHQLVRHRIASFSQQSQRYVKIDDEGLPFIIPESIRVNDKLYPIFVEILNQLKLTYNLLIDNGIKIEDARYILPQAVTTKIIITVNARELLHIFKLRCCNRAQWEIREVALQMLKEVKKIAPLVFEDAGPPCLSGLCPEGELSCGHPWVKNKKDKE